MRCFPRVVAPGVFARFRFELSFTREMTMHSPSLALWTFAASDGHTPISDVASQTFETVGTTRQAVVDTFRDVFYQTMGMAPNVIAAILILVVGFVVARLLARVA